MNKFLLIILLFTSTFLFGQECTHFFYGYVYDQSTGNKLSKAQVHILELNQKTTTDSSGYFQLSVPCNADIHIQINHLACEGILFHFNVSSDTLVHFTLIHNDEWMDEVTIHDKRNSSTTLSETITKQSINEQAHLSLGDIISSIAGVSVLKSGAGLAKPIIHGLYGNRITIVNHGVVQAGQQWGNDHAPAIDAQSAHHISVLKGAAALEYVGGSLGGVVLIESGGIKNDPHLHGSINSIFQTNGRGFTNSFFLERTEKKFHWKLNATSKQMGDRKTPDYFLNNTGVKENNLSLDLKSNRWKNVVITNYFSLFSAEIGILRGAHLGNLTDLETAIERKIPFYTENDFSRTIEEPRQNVFHLLNSTKMTFVINNKQSLNLLYSYQENRRKEFDVRRASRSEKPALSLKQKTQQLEFKHLWQISQKWSLKSGVQLLNKKNLNIFETGILPLIPNYLQQNIGSYSVAIFNHKSNILELGIRYDYKYFDVFNISNNLPRLVENNQHRFNTLNGNIGFQKNFKNIKLSTNLGFVERAPEINELYSFGLHQGVGGLEEGNANLEREKSLKVMETINWKIGQMFRMQASVYYQNISGFIYLKPDSVYRLTIRGAFPVFNYVQNDVSINGIDFKATYEPIRFVKLISKLSYVQGTLKNSKLPLIYMPPFSMDNSAEISFHGKHKIKEYNFTIHHQFKARQNRYDPNADFLVPPEAFNLLNLTYGMKFKFKSLNISTSVVVSNVFNKVYRDYLNRWRYFADEDGRNIAARLMVDF